MSVQHDNVGNFFFDGMRHIKDKLFYLIEAGDVVILAKAGIL